MKESDSEGVANHAALESCGACRKGWAEALTGESTGRAIEPRKFITSGRRRSGYVRKATPGAPKTRGAQGSREVEDPGTKGRAMHGNREVPGSPEEQWLATRREVQAQDLGTD